MPFKKKCLFNDFLICGFTGWCFECLFTGLHSILQGKDPKLTCRTSIWMFPIYGMASVLTPICRFLKGKSALLRGGIYAACIYLGEFVSGTLLQKIKACPWDYSHARLNYKGVVRLDYAPLWALAGLYYEKILSRKD